MRISKKKSSLALALVALLAVVVGVAWAVDADFTTATSSVFDYSNTYNTTGVNGLTTGTVNYINAPFNYATPLNVLGANNDMTAATWTNPGVNGTSTFQTNQLSVTSGTASDSGITFAALPAIFTKLGAGKLTFSAGNTTTALPALATTVSGGTLEVQNDGSIGTGAITVNV